MRSDKLRQQSAIEYLMTYGWAILVILVVLAILFLMNIFNSGTFTPAGCQQQPGFLCSNPLLNASGYLSVSVGRNAAAINATGVACTLNSTAPASFSTIPTTQMLNGFTYQLLFQCRIPQSAIGSCFSGAIWVEYTEQGQTGLVSEIGRVDACVKTNGAVAVGNSTPCNSIPLKLDGSASNTWSGTAAGTATLSTTQANDIIVVMVGSENPSAIEKVSSISSPKIPGGEWHERSNLSELTASYTDMEVWWAYSSNQLSSEPITATLAGSPDDATIIAFGISGADTAAPWDTNAALPAKATGSNATPSVKISTTAQNALILGFASTASNPVITPGGGFSQIQNIVAAGGAMFDSGLAEYTVASSPQTGRAVNATLGVHELWLLSGDAIKQSCS